ncbi:MAG: transcription antitermination factor NusB [Actinomycetota bacterium]
MSARTKSRKRALDALYASGLRSEDAVELLSQTAKEVEGHQNQDAIFDYAETLVSGYQQHSAEIDAELSSLSDGWALERMPGIDRAILRLGAWEILHNPEVPNEVAIAEAVALAGEFSTEDSPKFINGVLARLAKSRQSL